jgi:hypothetical protein
VIAANTVGLAAAAPLGQRGRVCRAGVAAIPSRGGVDHGTAEEQPPQPHLYGSDLGGIAPSDYPMFESSALASLWLDGFPQIEVLAWFIYFSQLGHDLLSIKPL